MLVLPIKKKWFDMILSGEKKEEYREISEYWRARFYTVFGEIALWRPHLRFDNIESRTAEIIFRNGYSKDSSSFIARCTLDVDTGKEEWGAERDKMYFVLTVHEILKVNQKIIERENT